MNQPGRLSKLLYQKASVATRAVFWRIAHNSGKVDIHLKIGRYRRSADPFGNDVLDEVSPKSELTLTTEELVPLMQFLQENYEPFKQGVKAFIPLEKPFTVDNANELRKLFSLPDKKKLVKFLVDQSVIPSDVYLSVESLRRATAVREFENLLKADHPESIWQK